ncbi:MAG: translation initiation factor IF-2 [Candidatus Paceibacterota bacterium]
MENSQEEKKLISRPPIVVVLGHVDHGKTTLLDYIRKTKVAEKEAGGITQSIGAYEAEIKGKKITFIDTPGHEAFLTLRSRGAKIADLAILVVASDEGVKPQTKESLKIIEQSKIPFLIALTKIDKEGANPEKVKRELAEEGVFLEGWGGHIPWVEVSAKTGKGIDELLELIILMGEMEGLTGDPNVLASGYILESYLDPKRGPTAILIITNGTLKIKDEIFAGNVFGKVKILENFLGQPISEATFSSPVRVIGFEEIPQVGEEFFVYKDKKELELILQERQKQRETKRFLGDLNSQIKIPLIIKADNKGSLEALEFLIEKIANENQWLFLVLEKEVGDLTDGDLKLANPLGTIIITFKVKKRPEANNLLLANPRLVLLEGEIIYEIEEQLINTVKEKFIEKPTEEIIGQLEVLAIFNPSKGYQIIGGKVIQGKVINKHRFHLKRNNEILSDGTLVGLQRNKIEVNEVNEGQECGLMVDCSFDIQKGDLLEFFRKI